jgi:hypothetical protein
MQPKPLLTHAVMEEAQGATSWGSGELCNDTSVMSHAAVENSGLGEAARVKSLFVNCVDRASDAESAVDHLAITFSSEGVNKITVFSRGLPPSPLTANLLAVLGISSAVGQSARVRPIETFESCAAEVAGDGGEGDGSPGNATEWVFFALDLQCQGLRNDRCTCVQGEVRCVLGTAAGGWEPHNMVTEEDLLVLRNPDSRPAWCSDGDPAEGWLLLTVRLLATPTTLTGAARQ